MVNRYEEETPNRYQEMKLAEMSMLSPKPNSFYHTEHKMALGYENPHYLKQAQKKQQSLYNGKVLLDKHDPSVVYDSEETLQLAQEKAAKLVRDFKSLAKEADESLDKITVLEAENERLLRVVISKDIMSIVQNHYVKLDDENVSLEFQILNYAKENKHLKTIYKNLFDSIKVTRAQTKIITDSLQEKLNDMIFQNATLRAYLHTKFSEQQNTVNGTSTNPKYEKPSILGKPPLQSFRNQSVSRQPTAFQFERPKFLKKPFIPKVVEKNDLTKLVTSYSEPKSQELKVVQNEKVIALGIFRINPLKNSRVENFMPNKHVKASVRTKPITISQPHVITKKDVHSNNQKHTSSAGINIKLATRNDKSEVVCATCKQCLITANHDECVFKYVNGMNSSKKNQSANASKSVNQTKHKAHVKKSKKLGSEETLASPRPRKPRTCLSQNQRDLPRDTPIDRLEVLSRWRNYHIPVESSMPHAHTISSRIYSRHQSRLEESSKHSRYTSASFDKQDLPLRSMLREIVSLQVMSKVRIKIKIQDHKHAKGTAKEFPRIQGSKIHDVTGMKPYVQ
ncbi:hypothetical protein Tco_0429699 [Tanacetum coccineum]